MSSDKGSELIDELLGDPAKFCDNGRAYGLLQAYFAGFPKETLRPLLRHNDVWVQRSAAFVVSELGSAAASLVDEFPSLLSSPDEHVVWYGMEALAVCAKGTSAPLFGHVASMLESKSEPIRHLAMRLMTRVDASQLEAAREYFDDRGQQAQVHSRELRALTVEHPEERAIAAMVEDSDPLNRRYGAIAAIRFRRRFPALQALLEQSNDPDVRIVSK